MYENLTLFDRFIMNKQKRLQFSKKKNKSKPEMYILKMIFLFNIILIFKI